jgi:hypothetical protein
MSRSRYDKLVPIRNIDDGYKKLYPYSRFTTSNGIKQYPSLNLKFPTDSQIQSYSIQIESWTLGQRLYKLADKYYGDPQYWWIIAFFNRKPTEQHFALGDTVEIPLPLNAVLSDMGL